MGVRAIKNASPKPVKDAIAEFFKSGASTATGGWKYALKQWFERFARDFPETQDVKTITAEEVAEHVHKQDCSSDTKRRLKINLAKFMRHSTSGHFDEFALSELTKALAKQTKAESNKNWFWLTNKQSLKIIENLNTFGQYWSDAALLQYGTGVRAEELVLLQSSDVKILKGSAQIKIARIFDGKQLVRRVKTYKSEDFVHVPKFAIGALERRLAEKSFLLFPCYDYKTLIASKYHQRLTDFEKEHKLWSMPSELEDSADEDTSNGEYGFSAAYLPRLRKAASGIEGLNPKNVDSRTFRRTCARELILKHGYERAASVIRDSVETLRKHYADLKSSDTSTER